MRYHFSIAYTEIDSEAISNIIEFSTKERVVERLESIVFDHIVIGLDRYRTSTVDGHKN